MRHQRKNITKLDELSDILGKHRQGLCLALEAGRTDLLTASQWWPRWGVRLPGWGAGCGARRQEPGED